MMNGSRCVILQAYTAILYLNPTKWHRGTTQESSHMCSVHAVTVLHSYKNACNHRIWICRRLIKLCDLHTDIYALGRDGGVLRIWEGTEPTGTSLLFAIATQQCMYMYTFVCGRGHISLQKRARSIESPLRDTQPNGSPVCRRTSDLHSHAESLRRPELRWRCISRGQGSEQAV